MNVREGLREVNGFVWPQHIVEPPKAEGLFRTFSPLRHRLELDVIHPYVGVDNDGDDVV